jgi:hypothetical protein
LIYIDDLTVGVSNFNKDELLRAHKVLAKRNISLASNQVRFCFSSRVDILLRKVKTVPIIELDKLAGGIFPTEDEPRKKWLVSYMC